jgi:hypothetical protein
VKKTININARTTRVGNTMKTSSTLKKHFINLGMASILVASMSMTTLSGNAVAAVSLEATIEHGIPVPAKTNMKSLELTPFLVTSMVTVPAALQDVAALYRTELSKLGWQEVAGKSVLTDAVAALSFTTPDGPAQLTLVAMGGDTQVNLSLRKTETARSAGLLPVEGQTKVTFGNFLDSEATVTINSQVFKIAAHAGESALDGPSLDMKPGSYAYKLEAPGEEPVLAELVVGPDEIWGLMVAPGGILPMKMY